MPNFDARQGAFPPPLTSVRSPDLFDATPEFVAATFRALCVPTIYVGKVGQVFVECGGLLPPPLGAAVKRAGHPSRAFSHPERRNTIREAYDQLRLLS